MEEGQWNYRSSGKLKLRRLKVVFGVINLSKLPFLLFLIVPRDMTYGSHMRGFLIHRLLSTKVPSTTTEDPACKNMLNNIDLGLC